MRKYLSQLPHDRYCTSPYKTYSIYSPELEAYLPDARVHWIGILHRLQKNSLVFRQQFQLPPERNSYLLAIAWYINRIRHMYIY